MRAGCRRSLKRRSTRSSETISAGSWGCSTDRGHRGPVVGTPTMHPRAAPTMQALPARCIIALRQRGRRGCPGVGQEKADEAGAGRPGIKTFLIADVRGYTLFTQQRGDEAAAKLAARFAEIAREAVDDHGGSV